jgi:signal transduction histidine kinase
MPSELKTATAMFTHPWSEHVSSLSTLGIGYVVVQIHDVAKSSAELRALSAKVTENHDQLELAETIARLLSGIEIIDANQSAFDALGARHGDSVTTHFIERFKHVPVVKTIEIMSMFLAGNGQFSLPPSGGLSVRAQVRNSRADGDTVSSLLTVTAEDVRAATSLQGAMVTAAVSALPEAILIVDSNGHTIYHNDSARGFWLESAGVSEFNFRTILSPGSYKKFSDFAFGSIGSGSVWQGRLEVRLSAGDAKFHERAVTVTRFKVDTSSIQESLCLVLFGESGGQDSRGDQAASLEEINRLSAVGKIAAQVIHEINNPVTVINGKAEKIQWVLDGVPAGTARQDISDCAQKILGMTERIGRIIKGMKNLTRNVSGEPKVVCFPSDVVREALDLVEVVAKKSGVKLRHLGIDAPVKVPMQRLRLSQVLVNLAGNGIDAVKNRDERWVEIAFRSDETWAYFSVTDSGKGIPLEVKARLFETYFSTKGAGLGTGIGLSLARNIVKEHGGELYLDESSGNTAFVVKLPLKAA